MTIQTSKPPVPVDAVKGLRPYALPPRPPSIDLHLDLNEGTPTTDLVMPALASVSPEQVRLYESPTKLEARIAERWDLDPARVVVTAGADQAIDAVCRAYLQPGRRMLAHTPSFEMIPRSATLAGGAIDEVVWTHGRFPKAEYLAAITPSTSVCAVVSPNNPTGGALTREELSEAADAAGVNGALFMADLAYAEFSVEASDYRIVRDMAERTNCVMLRTFSKAYGLAGLRVGYAIADVDVASALRTIVGPFPVSTLATVAAGVAFDASDDLLAGMARIGNERQELLDLLTTLGVVVNPSEANFLLVRVSDAVALRDALGERGIAVRVWPGREHLADAVRIALPGNDEHFVRLRDAIAEILGGAS